MTYDRQRQGTLADKNAQLDVPIECGFGEVGWRDEDRLAIGDDGLGMKLAREAVSQAQHPAVPGPPCIPSWPGLPMLSD